MKIIVDDKIPYIRGVFEPFADVVYLPGNKTTAEIVKDADAIITRTRTKCNRELLAGSTVRFIATATIGFDHIDTTFCHDAGIEWTNAKGCNAESVNQYIASALFSWSLKTGTDLKEKTIGIVGVGEVGSRVEKLCKNIGMKTLLNDPPRERTEGAGKFVSIEHIRRHADIITFHVPLNLTGDDATFHMVNENFINALEKKPLLINTCRGEVTDTNTIKSALKFNRIAGFIADCWEYEPDIDLELLKLADFGTPHIAGYSRDGKANGTTMSVRAISRFFNLGIDNWKPGNVELPEKTILYINGKNQSENAILAEAVLSTYNLKTDDEALRANPSLFEKLRGDYPVRREFGAYTIIPGNVDDNTLDKLSKMGFKVKN